MISYLKGTLIRKSTNKVILDIHGVGYGVSIPLSTYLKLGNIDDPQELHIYTHVTDSAIALYGFISEREKDLFLKLISISGIGPKIALNILSGIEASDLEDAI
jgi:Holliday junction DNA helicase RuvA